MASSAATMRLGPRTISTPAGSAVCGDSEFFCPLPRSLDRDRNLGGLFFVRIGQRDELADAAAHRFCRMKDRHRASMGWRWAKWLDLAFKIARRSTPRDRRVCPEAFAGYSRAALCRCAQGKSRTLEALYSHNTHIGRIDFPNSGGLEPARRTFGWCRGPQLNITTSASTFGSI